MVKHEVGEIRKHCQEIVGHSYVLMEACINYEREAKNRIGY